MNSKRGSDAKFDSRLCSRLDPRRSSKTLYWQYLSEGLKISMVNVNTYGIKAVLLGHENEAHQRRPARDKLNPLMANPVGECIRKRLILALIDPPHSDPG